MPLTKAKANNPNPNGGTFQVPALIKTTAANTDYFIGIDASGLLYKISKSNLLAGLSSGTSPAPSSIPSDAITGFDGVNEFVIQIGDSYLSQ